MLRAMCAQRSNREALLEGALRCLEDHPSSKITARQIATASSANLNSIGYHFGSTEALLAEAMAMGFGRWLDEMTSEMGDLAEMDTVLRILRAGEILIAGVERRSGLLHAFLTAVANAPHNPKLKAVLGQRFSESRTRIAELLGLGDDDAAIDAASLIIANFDGLLVQAAISDDEPFEVQNLQQGIARLISVARS
jgi:AcrR family transcriptional regulator